MKLVLSNDYPASPPRGFFLTKIYHPNVANNGDICVNTLKKDWSPETTLKHVLQVIRCLLIVPFPESSLNDEAGKLFMDSYEEFARRARLMTEVHALDELEENDEKDDNGEEIEKEGEQDEAGSAKVGADGVKLDGAGNNMLSAQSSGDDVVDEGSSSTKSNSSSTKSTKDKKRDAKKKSLKRL
jgi:ubiquitin-conjugating enzyme E2 S